MKQQRKRDQTREPTDRQTTTTKQQRHGDPGSSLPPPSKKPYTREEKRRETTDRGHPDTISIPSQTGINKPHARRAANGEGQNK